MMLYASGHEYSGVTGGWTGGKYITEYKERVGTCEKRDSSLYCQAGGSSDLVSAGYFTSDKVDLTGYNKVFYNITDYYRGWACTMAVNKSSRVNNGAISADAKLGLCSVNITSLTEPAYVGFGCWAYGSIIATDLIVATKADAWREIAFYASILAENVTDLLKHSQVILNNKNATEYMIYNCTGDFMIQAVSNETFRNALDNSEYGSMVRANSHWSMFLSLV